MESGIPSFVPKPQAKAVPRFASAFGEGRYQFHQRLRLRVKHLTTDRSRYLWYFDPQCSVASVCHDRLLEPISQSRLKSGRFR